MKTIYRYSAESIDHLLERYRIRRKRDGIGGETARRNFHKDGRKRQQRKRRQSAASRGERIKANDRV